MQNFSNNESDMKTYKISSRVKKKSSNIFMALLLVMVVIVIAFYAYAKSLDGNFSKLSLESIFSAGKGNETVYSTISDIPYESKENTAFAVYRNYIAKAGSEGIILLDKTGTEIWTDSVPMGKPVIMTNGEDLLIADVGGMDFVVLNGKTEKWRGKADGKIINADISSDGHVTILSYAKRYEGEATVFDPMGVELYKTFIADNSPVSTRISPSSREMIVNCINTSGVRAQTYTKLYDADGKELSGKMLGPVNCIYPVMWYAGDDSIYFAGDTAITLLDKSGEQKWTQKYDTVYSACMAGNRNIAAAVKDKNGTEVKIFGTNGHELASCPIDSDVRNLSSFGNIIAVNTVREVYFVNDRGNVTGKYTSKADVLDVYFFNRHEAVVVSNSSVAVINIK